MAKSREDPDSYDLPTLFASLGGHYPDLTTPPEATLACLQGELHEARSKQLTGEYIGVTLGALFFMLTIPLVTGRGFRAVLALQPDVSRLLRHPEYLTSHPELGPFAFLAGFGAVFYSLVMHRLWTGALQSAVSSLATRHNRMRRFAQGLIARINRTPRFGQVNRADWRFVAYAIAVNYCAGWIGLLYLNSYTAADSSVARWTTIAWLYVPVLPAVVVPTFVFLFAFVVVSSRSRDLSREAPRSELLRQLLLLRKRTAEGVGHPGGVGTRSELRERLPTGG